MGTNKKTPINKMKKVLFTFAVIGSLAIVSCGPSAEEQAAAEQARLDSIAAVEQARLDSIAAAEAAAAAELAAQDTAAVEGTEVSEEAGHEGHSH